MARGSEHRIVLIAIFKSNDAIYAAVSTAGSGANVALTTRWLDRNGNVDFQSMQILNPTGPTVTDFSLPVGNRLKQGKYKIEGFIDNKSAGTMDSASPNNRIRGKTPGSPGVFWGAYENDFIPSPQTATMTVVMAGAFARQRVRYEADSGGIA